MRWLDEQLAENNGLQALRAELAATCAEVAAALGARSHNRRSSSD